MRRQVQPHKARDRTRRFTRNRLSRGRGLRETTGCLTCRRRHVKCDEAKPTCKACSRINKACAWPDDAPLPSRPDDAVATGTPECSTSSDGPRPAASPGHDAASPGGYAPTVTHPSPPRNATEEWSDGSGVVGARVSEAPAPSRTEARRRPATRSHPWPPSAHEQGSDTAREYILSPSSLQSAPQTLGASPHLDWLGPAVPGDWMPSALDAGGASQSFFNVDDATAAWASLLIHDASSRIEAGPGLGALGPLPPRDCEQQQEDALVAQRPSVQEAIPSTLDSGMAYEQDKPWQSSVPLKLEKHEYLLFQDFVQNLSLWMDFFDPTRPFGTIVPHLAMRNVGLMNAILALSIRHLSLNVRFQPKDSVPQDPLDALPFYFLTLRYIRSAMQHDSYRSSLELLATASIVSAYEMLDGSRPDWERHLRGLSCIQHAQRIHGASGGLRQAVWWTWLCQDVWAAWRERRKPLTTWRPHTPPPELDSFALAARAVYLFGQAVGFCAQDEVARGRRDPEARLASAQSLRLALDRWRKSLPPDFDPLPLDSADEDSVFEPIWIHPPNFGVAVQLYHCSCVLLLTNAPCLGGMAEYQKQQKQLEQHIRAICGIAMHLKGDPESVMCSQALFIAGLFIHEKRQREAVVDILESCWRRAGWPHESLGVELQREWNEAA